MVSGVIQHACVLQHLIHAFVVCPHHTFEHIQHTASDSGVTRRLQKTFQPKLIAAPSDRLPEKSETC